MNNNLVVSNLFTAAPRQLVLAKDKLSKRKQNDNIDTFQKMLSFHKSIKLGGGYLRLVVCFLYSLIRRVQFECKACCNLAEIECLQKFIANFIPILIKVH